MRIWPWRWHHGNSMKFQGLKSKAMAEVKSNHHPKPTKPCKIPWDHFKMYGKVDHKMCTAPQRQALFFKNLLNRQHGFPPAGMFLKYSSVPRCGIFQGGHFEHVSLPASFLQEESSFNSSMLEKGGRGWQFVAGCSPKQNKRPSGICTLCWMDSCGIRIEYQQVVSQETY